jgi:hypothetical protein
MDSILGERLSKVDMLGGLEWNGNELHRGEFL